MGKLQVLIVKMQRGLLEGPVCAYGGLERMRMVCSWWELCGDYVD